MCWSRKPVYLHGYRGFESHPLRFRTAFGKLSDHCNFRKAVFLALIHDMRTTLPRRTNPHLAPETRQLKDDEPDQGGLSMLRLFLITLCLSFTFTAARSEVRADDSSPDLIFLLIGQSNMAGRAHLIEGDDKPISGVVMLDDKGQWIPATNPLNRFATNRKKISMQRIGPGAGFAHRMHKAFPDKTIGLVINARGGTSINLWKKGDELYDNALKRVNAVPDIQIDGVLWHQGEADRNDQEYLAKLKSLVGTLRKDLDHATLPFVAGEVYGKGHVNKIFGAISETIPHTAAAKAADLKVFDGVHFDRESQLTLGTRYAEAMLKLLEAQKQ